MPAENIPSELNQSQFEPSLVAKAIAKRALTEAEQVRLDRMRMVGITQNEAPDGTRYDADILRITAQAVSLYLPHEGQTAWEPGDVPDYFTINETRLKLIPSATSVALEDLSIEDLFDEQASREASTRGSSVHQVLRDTFTVGGMFRPPVGDVSELTKMYKVAQELAEENPPGRLVMTRPKDLFVAQVYLKGEATESRSRSPYDELQVRYYTEPSKLADVGFQAISAITGATMARYETYKETGELPAPDEGIPVYERHLDAVAEQRVFRGRILHNRINHLWP